MEQNCEIEVKSQNTNLMSYKYNLEILNKENPIHENRST